MVRRSLSVLACALIATLPALAQGGSSAGLRVVVLEGDGGINNVRARPAREPRIRVEDRAGEPLSKVPVTFVSPGVGASGTFANGGTTITVITDEDGDAAATGFRPNNLVGQFQIRVSASRGGEIARASITQTNAAPAQEARGKRIMILGLVAGAVAGGAIAAASMGGGNGPASGTARPSSPSLGISPGDPSFGPPR